MAVLFDLVFFYMYFSDILYIETHLVCEAVEHYKAKTEQILALLILLHGFHWDQT